MEIDSKVLLCLLAVRQLGGNGVHAKQDVFTKGLKAELKAAQDQGWVQAEKTTVRGATPDGKSKPSKVDVLHLTAAGEQVLRQCADPAALAATAAAHAGGLKEKLEADRQQLRSEVLAALAGQATGKPKDAGKELTTVAKVVTDLAKRLDALEQKLSGSSADAIIAKIDQAFSVLHAKLAGVGPGPTSAARPAASPPQAALAEVLRQSYRTLRQFVEFNDGLVPIPRLYHEARRSLPHLSVEALHRELQTLWDRREVELKVLNEVRTASEPDKAITRGENLYYYVYWQNP